MAFFKFRQRGPQGDAPATGGSQKSIDSLRRRARHRLVGAAVLVLAAVIGFPLLFDTQPRPVAVDAPITIPDKNKVTPLRVPATAASRESLPASVSLAEREEILPPTVPPAQRPSEPASQPAAPARPASAQRPAQADTRAADEAARAKREEQAKAQRAADEAKSRREAERVRALLAGKKPPPAESASAPDAAAGKGRFIIQIGAFADEAKVREVRQQAERTGLKTYAQAVDTKDGKRTRVRVGPYASRAEAEKAAATLKKAGLPGAILSL